MCRIPPANGQQTGSSDGGREGIISGFLRLCIVILLSISLFPSFSKGSASEQGCLHTMAEMGERIKFSAQKFLLPFPPHAHLLEQHINGSHTLCTLVSAFISLNVLMKLISVAGHVRSLFFFIAFQLLIFKGQCQFFYHSNLVFIKWTLHIK